MAIAELPIAVESIAQNGSTSTTGPVYKPTVEQILAAEAESLTNPYTALITSEFKTPQFLAFVYYCTQMLHENVLLLNDYMYDIDTAIGFQLDYIGQWVGFSRYISSPLSGIFFSFDNDGLGFDLGYWQNEYTANGLSALIDSDYRQILKLKIAANSWDGSIPSALAILQSVFPNTGIIIQDNQDMSMTIILEGVVNLVTQSLLNAGYFDLRPAGVSITYSTTTIAFGFDISTSFIGGFDVGSWT